MLLPELVLSVYFSLLRVTASCLVTVFQRKHSVQLNWWNRLIFGNANVQIFDFRCCWTLKLCFYTAAANPADLYALSVASLSRQAGAARLILFYLRAPLNINAVFSLNYSLAGLPALSAFLYLPLCLSSALHLYLPALLLAQSFPPQRLISDDIRCDGLLALIRLFHDFMTLILPLEQNLLLYFDRWMAFGSV